MEKCKNNLLLLAHAQVRVEDKKRNSSQQAEVARLEFQRKVIVTACVYYHSIKWCLFLGLDEEIQAVAAEPLHSEHPSPKAPLESLQSVEGRDEAGIFTTPFPYRF